MQKDVFLSHATEDKDSIVIPFSRELERLHISYWLDSIELLPGDSLTEKIFNGIHQSQLVIVFLSSNFINKGWATAELRSALSRQIRENKKIVIPFLVNIDFHDVVKKFPEFENIFCSNIIGGIDYAARQVQKIIFSSKKYHSLYYSKSDLINIQNIYHPRMFDLLSKLSYDQLVNLDIKENVDALYSYCFSDFGDDKITKFIDDRLELFKGIPMESFFQFSLLRNLQDTSLSKDIPSRIMLNYPIMDKDKFTHIKLKGSEDKSFFTEIPSGNFIFGADENDPFKKEWVDKCHEVYLDDFSISITPIVNIQYENFNPEHFSMRLPSKDNTNYHPVVNVNWYEAAMFTNWMSYYLNSEINLPTEYQWEKAASWGKAGKYRFPWGDNWNPNHCNTWDGENIVGSTTVVGLYENGKSQHGLYDMSGNIWEWCRDWFSENWGQYIELNSTNPQGPLSGNRKIDRGGGWYQDVGYPTVHIRAADYPKDRFPHCGFRVVNLSRS